MPRADEWTLDVQYLGRHGSLTMSPEATIARLAFDAAAMLDVDTSRFVRIVHLGGYTMFRDVSSADEDSPSIAAWQRDAGEGSGRRFAIYPGAEVEEAERGDERCMHGSPARHGVGFLCGWC